METQASDFRQVRFSSDDLPERDRVPVWREFFGRFVFRTEIEPAPEATFHADVTVRGVPSLELVSSAFSPIKLSRTPALVADGNDDVSLFVATCSGTLCQFGREIEFHPGDAIVATASEPATWTARAAARYRCLHVRRGELAPFVANLDPAAVLGRVTPDSEALRYLLNYFRFLEKQQTLADPDLARVAAIHVRDLFALALGATRDAAFVAQGRGLRAARLHAIKRHIADNLHDGRLTVGAVASHHRVTSRYVQRLFEDEGTTFSEFLLDQRLLRAQHMLADPRYADWRVSAIALEVGFGDVSYFNRRFRRRFGETPGHFARGAARSMTLD